MNIIPGSSAADGIGIGKAFVLPEDQERKIPSRKIKEEEQDAEWARLVAACEQVNQELSQSLTAENISRDQKELFEAYLLMLGDAVFMQELKDFFSKKLFNVEFALVHKVKEYADMLRGSNNEFLAQRAQDIEDVFYRVLDVLLDYQPFDLSVVPEGSVLAARYIKPSDAVVLAQKKIAGVVMTEGSDACHVAILAKGYGIPVVVGIEDIPDKIQNGNTVIVDGDTGEIIVEPDDATLISTKARIVAKEKYRINLQKYNTVPAKTEDGTEFRLYANIGTPEEAAAAIENGADGIGLFRTEFLFMNAAQKRKGRNGKYSVSISEEDQFQAYKSVLEAMGGKPVTIRTLDAGGDKIIKNSDLPSMAEKNPLMGLRAIRMSLYYPAVFRTQLRALYRASVYGNLRIMLPLITDVSQVDTACGIASGVRIALKEEGIPFNPDVPIGIMVETAAAAICADVLAPHAAFFSLGTNDLTQYVLGVDRENQAVNPLYNEFNLAVLRMIRSTIFNAQKYNIPLSVCGEMAGSKESAVILAGLGVRDLSMPPRQIPVIKEMLSHFSIAELENLSKSSVF